MSDIRFSCFPRTKPPPEFVASVVDVFRAHESAISTVKLKKGLESDGVLQRLAKDLRHIGFEVEANKSRGGKIARPVFYGENGNPSLRYEIDGYHQVWKCGLEVEAGRAVLGNAIFRDLFQAMVMTDVDHLVLAVPNSYKFSNKEKPQSLNNYAKTVAVSESLYGHTRVVMPYGLTVVGY